MTNGLTQKHVVCNRCVMDTSDKDIYFDVNGVCNHCLNFDNSYLVSPDDEITNLKALMQKLKQSSNGYDCIVGMSGGVDSSYVAHLAGKLGLNPLVVHLDNGWNSKLAIRNVSKIIEKNAFQLETLIIDWREFRDLQKSFLRAGVVDIELLTDHAITATLYRLAQKHNIKYILSGVNYATEHGMPLSWNWNKDDKTNIEAIHKQFGEVKLNTFPLIAQKKLANMRDSASGPESINILNLIRYSASRAKTELQQVYRWEAYTGKHFESVFTRFYQSYILPQKFGIDKRKVHLSALIRNGEISREEAVNVLLEPILSDKELNRDKEYLLEKLEMTDEEFNALMSQPPVTHDTYDSDFDSNHKLKVKRSPLGAVFRGVQLAEQQANALYKYLVKHHKGKPFVIYGAGEIGQKLLEIVNGKRGKMELVGIVDGKAQHNHHRLGAFDVVSPEDIHLLTCEVILIASEKYQHEIYKNLQTRSDIKNMELVRLSDCE